MRTETASRTPLWPASIIPASAFRSQCSARLVSAAPVARVRAASRLSPARTRTPIPPIVGFRSITASLPVASTVVTARVSILPRSEEHTSELQSLMRISYAVFCLKKKKHQIKISNKYNYTHPETEQNREKSNYQTKLIIRNHIM